MAETQWMSYQAEVLERELGDLIADDRKRIFLQGLLIGLNGQMYRDWQELIRIVSLMEQGWRYAGIFWDQLTPEQQQSFKDDMERDAEPPYDFDSMIKHHRL